MASVNVLHRVKRQTSPREPSRGKESQTCLVTYRMGPCNPTGTPRVLSHCPCNSQAFMAESALFLKRGNCKYLAYLMHREGVQCTGGITTKEESGGSRADVPQVLLLPLSLIAEGGEPGSGFHLPINLSLGPLFSLGLSLLLC